MQTIDYQCTVGHCVPCWIVRAFAQPPGFPVTPEVVGMLPDGDFGVGYDGMLWLMGALPDVSPSEDGGWFSS